MRRFFFYFVLPVIFLLSFTPIAAVELSDCEKEHIDPANVSACIDILSNKVRDLGDQKKTIASQIAQFDNQIRITQLKISEAEATIAQLEKEINVLGFRIGYITDSVDKLEVLLKKRIVAAYQQSFISNFELLITSHDFSDLILKVQYLKQIQENDKKLLGNLQTTKSNYANQKDEREEKQAAIEENKKKLLGLKTSLDSQKVEKQKFLEITKNDEARFQQLLAQALAEKKAISAAFSEAVSRLNKGEGESVSEGQTIAIVGNSGSPTCSTGPHLHFMVTKDGVTQDPAGYLKDVSPGWDNPDPKPSFSGSWNWPISNPTVNQIYGKSYYVINFGWYGGGIHDGIDMVGGSSITAPRAGKLILGSTYCGSSVLKYAAVKHNDDPGIITLYLHIQ